MFLQLISGAVVTACVVASAKRMAIATAPVAFDPRTVLDAVQSHPDRRLLAALAGVMACDPKTATESRLLGALTLKPGDEREARVAEELLEIEGAAQQWARVPRVCASVASSTGFLLASVALMGGMGAAESAVPEETSAALHATLSTALGVLSFGIAAASFCASVHMRARRAVRERMSALGRLIEWAGDDHAKQPNS